MSKKHLRDPLEAKFIAEYVANGGNGTQAYLKTHPNSSEEAARVSATRLIAKANVWQEIERSLRAKVSKIDLKGEQVLLELWRILNVDIAQAYNEDGSLKSIHDIPEDVRRAISGIEVDEIWEFEGEGREKRKVQCGETKKVKFWSKTEAANLLGKHLKLWLENNAGINLFANGDVEMVLQIKT